MNPTAHRAPRLVFWLLSSLGVAAADIDESKLPAPESQPIDFQRDIKPILQENCLRCHGPERPKSNFRLTDRALALKGGNNGVDIVPGDSAKSPLIHYVARLVPDMEMPPEGKGAPLATNQVALLRAWIDQGVVWNDGSNQLATASIIEVTPLVLGTVVQGDKAKFRELEWRPDGWDGGVERFSLSQQGADGRTVTTEGHLSRDDYHLTLDLKKPELGFARLGFEQYRKYYDDGGGYYGGFTPPFYRLGEDLHLDIGRVWVELGLTLPQWPRLVIGYEHQYKDGAKSMLTWGPVASPTGDFLDARSIYPAFEQINESADIFRLGVTFDTHGYQLEDTLRAEIHSLNTRRTDALYVSAGGAAPDLLTVVQEAHHSLQIDNTARVQKQLYDWWLAGVGYRYSWLDADSSLHLNPQDAAGQPAAGSAWSANKLLLNEIWQVANATSQFQPLRQFTATIGIQGQWKRQETFGDANMDEVVDPADPTSGIFRYPATEQSALNQTTAEENIVLRYTGLPFTVLFAEARLKQEDYSRTADQDGGPHAFQLASDAAATWQDYLVGFSSSPWARVSFGGHYRHRDRHTQYDYSLAQHDGAYPGFIQARGIVADEIEARATFRPANWVTATLTYRWNDSDYRTTTGATSADLAGADATPGGQVLAGRYRTHGVSANATFTPIRRVSLSATLSYLNSDTTTADNGSASVAPYRGDLWSVFASVNWTIDDSTDLFAGYTFSQARYGQNNTQDGLPLGTDFDRHGIQMGLRHAFNRTVTGRLQYAYFSYNEPTSGHLVDFTAHQVLASVNLHW